MYTVRTQPKDTWIQHTRETARLYSTSHVKNLLPVVGRIVTSDGDAPCALELITRERPGSTSKCSPKYCRQVLKYFLPAGS
eukprot:SAG11_NODE_31204_length_293_cov_12.015464_1_plen_80_part_01